MKTHFVIKICGMRDEQNIASVDALKPDYLGFIFYPPSPRYVDAEAVLPNTRAKKTGVFVDEKVSTILHLAQKHQLTAIQLHGQESPQTCQILKDMGFEVFKAFRVNAETTVDEVAPYTGHCHYFLYDTKATKLGGTGKKFDWGLLEKFDALGPFLLSGGIAPGDADLIKKLTLSNLKGLDLNSKFEDSPAKKNTRAVEEFLATLFESNKTKQI